jgi:hypothetical protein
MLRPAPSALVSVVAVVSVVTGLPACAVAEDDAPAGRRPETFDDAAELDAMARAFVDAHDVARAAAVPTPDPPLPGVRWDADVAAVAQAWAEGCVFEHSGAPALGENLALFSNPQTTPEEVVQAWASEIAFYDYATDSCAPGEQCGHYTQIVWRDSTGVGCGVAACDDVAGFGAGLLWVCNYTPPGNFIGQRPY